MKKGIVLLLIVSIVCFAYGASAVSRVTDYDDLTSYIDRCERFEAYEAIAEALLCAACIPYGESPEDCVALLQDKGFDFEYKIGVDMAHDIDLFDDVVYSADGTPSLPIMRQVELVFSPVVSLFLRTESQMIALKTTVDNPDVQRADLWTPAEPVTGGKIMAAHLQFFDKEAQAWITWTLTSDDIYKEP